MLFDVGVNDGGLANDDFYFPHVPMEEPPILKGHGEIWILEVVTEWLFEN